jgi:hypothetical protein
MGVPSLHVYSDDVRHPVQAIEPERFIREHGGKLILVLIWTDAQWRALPDGQKPPTAQQSNDGRGSYWMDIQPFPPGLRLGLPES